MATPVSTQTTDGSDTDNCYTITNSWIATDNCGNSIEHTQVITVEDNVDPVFTNAPANETIECTDAIPTYNVLATDNCDTDVEVTMATPVSTQTTDGSATDNCYTISNSWIATDNCGNSIEHTQIITIEDNVDPVFTNAPADETIECTDATPTYNVVATDNCDTDVEVTMATPVSTQTMDGSDSDNCYTITNSWIATDNCGNSIEHTQVITVEDTVDPAFTNAPADETIECTDAIPTYNVVATDNCDTDVEVTMATPVSTQTTDGSDTDNCYTITNSWIATDNCGNSIEHTQIITVEDTVDPVFTNAPADETIECTEAIPTYTMSSLLIIVITDVEL